MDTFGCDLLPPSAVQVPVGSSRTMQELPPLDHASVRALSLLDGWGFTASPNEPSQINRMSGRRFLIVP